MNSGTPQSTDSTLWASIASLLEMYPSRTGPAARKESAEWGLAERIRDSLDEFARERVPSEHWSTNASVGMGRWALVPWAAVFDDRVTEGASRGVYVVLNLICEGTPGVRVGIGLASDEHKWNSARLQETAKGVLERFSSESRDALSRAGLVEPGGSDASESQGVRSGRTGPWSDGMVFQAFVPLGEIAQRRQDLDAMLETSLREYKRWADSRVVAEPHAASGLENRESARWWVISAGRNGKYWPVFRERGIVSIDWGMGDLAQFPDKEAIYDKLVSKRSSSTKPTNAALALYQFSREISVGDIIIAKQGTSRFFGIGVVTSDYRYDPNTKNHPYVRDVDWVHLGSWSSGELRVPVKTLTEVTRYRRFRAFIESVLGKDSHEGPLDENLTEDIEIAEPFELDDALSDLFLDRNEILQILARLRRKKNLILTGPPGVGKSYAARRLAWLLIGEQSAERVQTVQFHQSYSYEDFVQGIRPNAIARGRSGFRVRNGPFYEFCRRAEGDPSRAYVLLIDEINRGNLSRILGELLMLIEHDKRGPDHAIPLTYSEDLADTFSVPENLHIIGMMNTADRSLSIVDYALRRRFAFVRLRPLFDSPRFADSLRLAGASDGLIRRIVERMTELNRDIAADTANLGPGYEIGHSFFCADRDADDEWFGDVIESEIKPLLEEYWWEDPQKASDLVERLRR